MHSTALLERTDSFLNVSSHNPTAPVGVRTAAPFVTISRECGSGGASLARLLAIELNRDTPPEVVWKIYGGNLTATMLRANRLPTYLARFLPEDRVSEVRSSVGELVGLHPNLWELREKTRRTMISLARKGHAILMDRGGNYATTGLPGGVHIRLVAPAEHRAKFLANLYNLTEAQAAAYNAKCDRGRRRYAKIMYNADPSDPAAYDMVINTGGVSLEEAAKLVAERVRLKMAPAAA